MKNTEYWEQAAVDRMLAMEQGSAYTAEEILILYDEALKDIEREIVTIRRNFQKRFGLDNDKATFFLTKAQEEENLQSLIKALEEAPTPEAKANILKYIKLDGLSVRAYAARTERYEALKKEIYARMKRLDVDESNIIKQRLKEVYREGYYGTIDEAAKNGITANFAMLNDRAIEEAVSHKWQGSRFSTRIWVHTDELAKKAQDIVIKSIMTGAAVEKTARLLEKEFEVSKFRSVTLVRTETAHIMNEAQFKAYEEIGIEEYMYSAALDDRTCDTCGALDRRTFKVSDRKEGLNAPVMHPRCRCTTVMASDKYKLRRVRNPETGKTYIISADTSYNEWYNGLSAEQKTAIKAHRNATSDKAQFERYKKVLGTKEVGRSLDKFQDMKYNDGKRWSELKWLYKGTNDGTIIKNATGDYVKIVEHTSLQYRPNTITQKINKKGGIDRNYYGADGWQYKQISNNDHGHKKESVFGEHGEHAHDNNTKNGKYEHKEARELTEVERKENKDIL